MRPPLRNSIPHRDLASPHQDLPYILAYRSHHRIGRTISFVLKKLNLALTRT